MSQQNKKKQIATYHSNNIKFWEKQIIMLQETQSCSIDFLDFTTEQKINYCKKMIERNEREISNN
jgi:hypothetical protein